jgi:hypothetical protein
MPHEVTRREVGRARQRGSILVTVVVDTRSRMLVATLPRMADEGRAVTEQAFQVNWNTVRDWVPDSRYEPSTPASKAHDMRAAVADEATGVLPWLKTQW